MPDRAPLRLCRDLGPAAVKLHMERGTGRRFKAYRNLLRSVFRCAYPPRIALVGAGEGIEVAEALLGLKGAARGPSGMDKCLYVLHRPGDAELIARVQRQGRYAVRGGRVVCLAEPWGDALDKLAATGGFWFSLIVIAPSAQAAWAVESLRALRALVTTGTRLVVCRCNDKPMKAVIAALNDYGWTDVSIGEVAILKRGAREPLPSLPPATEGERPDEQRGPDSQPTH